METIKNKELKALIYDRFIERMSAILGEEVVSSLDNVKKLQLLYLLCLEGCKEIPGTVAKYRPGILLPLFNFTAYDKGPVDNDIVEYILKLDKNKQ